MSEIAPLLVIVGPTAAGKSAAALDLALALRPRGEIVTADSQQVYRGLDIGTAKPAAKERRGIAHHLVDVVDPDDPFDAATYVRLADAAIAEIRARGRRVVVAGGTGLYVRALLRGLVDAPAADPALREALLSEERTAGTGTLWARLAGVDPAAARTLHPNDLVRIVRALEVHTLRGVRLSALQKEHAFAVPRHRARLFGLDVGRDVHRERIAARTRAMIEAGWVAEVRRLLDRYPPTLRSLGSLGYRQIVAHLTGGVPLESSVAAIVAATTRFARRQRTWFRSESAESAESAKPGIEWFTDPSALVAAALEPPEPPVPDEPPGTR